MASRHDINLTINGTAVAGSVEPRTTLVDFIRHEVALTGTHVGCEHGVCGACTILVDGVATRSCLMLAVQADGCEVTTVEGLVLEGQLHPIQQAFQEEHSLQCGFCTPGFLMSVQELLDEHPDPTDEQIKDVVGGNICRCTGYQNILNAVRTAAAKLRDAVSTAA